MRVGIFYCLLLLFSTLALSAQKNLSDTFGKSLKQYPHKPRAAGSKPDDGDVIKVKTELVSSEVLVLSPKGNPLLGLKKEDFQITENGVPQKIDIFSAAQDDKIGRSIILVIGYGIMIQPYIQESIEAAKVLIDKLGPHDKVALVSDRLELLSSFTSDKVALKNVITSYEQEFWKLKRSGQTRCLRVDSQYSSLLAALNELVQTSDTRPVVLFQTDGDEYPYLKPESKEWIEMDKNYAQLRKQCADKSEWEERPFSFEDIKDAVAVTGATVYSVIPGPRVLGVPKNEVLPRIARYANDFNKFNGIYGWGNDIEKLARWNLEWQGSMAEIAGFSGGYTEFLENPKDAQRVYDAILTIMNNRYVIGYYSHDETSDGKRRNLKIEIKGHPEYGSLSRKAYIPRPQ
jgi:VWFA-related protein